jgi:CBS domain containing-hemolysin-like protein
MSEIIIGLLAIVLQGFFAGSETAYSRANWIRITTWQKKPAAATLLRMRAPATLRLVANKERILIITLIFTNLCVVAASAVFSRFFIINFGPAYTTIAVIIVVVLSLVFGDFLPKAVAQAFPEHWSSLASPIFEFLSLIFSPFLSKPKNVQYHPLTRKDFLYLLKEKETKESLVTNQMAKALFDFSRLSVYEIMVPKERIVAFPDIADFSDIKKMVDKYRYSRYPVFKKTNDNIIGIINIKDILTAISRQEISLKDVMRKPYFVTPEEKATDVLKAMRQKGEHLALVHNEKNRTVGIVTLEDLLEEVVGEIRSET